MTTQAETAQRSDDELVGVYGDLPPAGRSR
jgi:hypothetical protein